MGKAKTNPALTRWLIVKYADYIEALHCRNEVFKEEDKSILAAHPYAIFKYASTYQTPDGVIPRSTAIITR